MFIFPFSRMDSSDVAKATLLLSVVITLFGCTHTLQGDEPVVAHYPAVPEWENTQAIEKSPLDQKQYRALRLENGLRVVLVSDVQADKAAAALDVHVGSQQDPADREGLAHYLEHMLFLGTEKYPEAGEYKKFIDDHGGQNNAYTSGAHTNYHFSIDADQLAPALDRFAQFFTAPLFTPKYVQRERAIVHSEYMARRKDEGRRLWTAGKEAYHPEHPARGFSVGSLQTLADREGDPVRDDLIDFYAQHYFAERMALAVVGKEPLDELETMARARFSDIRSGGAQPASNDTPLFAAGSLPMQLNLKPLITTYRVNFSFPIPSTEPFRQHKPLSSVSAILGHEGPGSILAVLKAKGWAESLSAGGGYMDAKQGTLDVSIKLTETGLAHVQEIGELLFAMIHNIELNGIDAWRFQEARQLDALSFRFQEAIEPYALARSLAARAHRWAPEDVLAGPYQRVRWLPKATREYLAYLTPDNVLVTVVDPKLQAAQQTDWYDVVFSKTNINPDWLAQWQTARTTGCCQSDLALPVENPFVPTDLDLAKGEGNEHDSPLSPTKLVDTPLLQAWHQTDTRFQLPKAHFYFSLRSPIASDTPQHAVLTELWVKAVNEQLNAFTYPAYEAGLHYRFYRHSRGVSARITGYSDKQAVLLQRLLDAMRDTPISAGKFEQYQAELDRDWQNASKGRPINAVTGKVYDTLLKNSWSNEEKRMALTGLTFKAVQQHQRDVLKQGELMVLSLGSISESESRSRVALLAQAFAEMQPQAVARPVLRRIQAGQAYGLKASLEQPDAALVWYWQGQENAIEETARINILAALVEPRFYKQLRTENEVGYLVYSHAFNMLDIPALLLSVQSNSHSVAEIETLIQGFLDDLSAALENLSEAEFETVRASLLAQLKEPPKTLSDLSGQAWREIDRSAAAFDTRARLITAMENTTQAEVVAIAEQLMSDTTARQLMVYSHGKLDTATPGVQVEDSLSALRQVITVSD